MFVGCLKFLSVAMFLGASALLVSVPLAMLSPDPNIIFGVVYTVPMGIAFAVIVLVCGGFLHFRLLQRFAVIGGMGLLAGVLLLFVPSVEVALRSFPAFYEVGGSFQGPIHFRTTKFGKSAKYLIDRETDGFSNFHAFHDHVEMAGWVPIYQNTSVRTKRLISERDRRIRYWKAGPVFSYPRSYLKIVSGLGPAKNGVRVVEVTYMPPKYTVVLAVSGIVVLFAVLCIKGLRTRRRSSGQGA